MKEKGKFVSKYHAKKTYPLFN